MEETTNERNNVLYHYDIYFLKKHFMLTKAIYHSDTEHCFYSYSTITFHLPLRISLN